MKRENRKRQEWEETQREMDGETANSRTMKESKGAVVCDGKRYRKSGKLRKKKG